jgi:hypothetical protein
VKKVDRMSFRPKKLKPKRFRWRPVLYVLGTLAMLALAVGARYKPH